MEFDEQPLYITDKINHGFSLLSQFNKKRVKGWPGYGGRGDWNVFHKPNPYAVEKWMHTVFNSVRH